MAEYSRLLKVARGDEPADLVIRGGQLINVLTGEIHPATVGICEDTIAYVTGAEDNRTAAKIEIDARGKWLCPGLIDCHMHIESTHVTPEYFAEAVLPLGVTCVAQDPHEIANVLGVAGVDYMRRAGQGLPLRVLTLISTCVPSVPGLETSGAVFTEREVEALLDGPDTPGLAEVMDYWGVIRQSPRISKIVQAGRRRGALITGHIRGLSGRELNTYLAAGIDSDHGWLSVEEMRARLRLGMTVEICCAEHRDNIAEMVAYWREGGSMENVVLVTDDVPPHTLVREGHLDRGVRKALALGMDPVAVIHTATMAAARRMRRPELGCIAPGRAADILVLDDLSQFKVGITLARGQVVASGGKMTQCLEAQAQPPEGALNSVHLPELAAQDFAVRGQGGHVRINVLTQRGAGALDERVLEVVDHEVYWQNQPDLALASVWHRHGRNHNHAFAWVAETGLKAGALATTYAHDSHNLVVLGRDAADMAVAANRLRELGGGYVAVRGGKLLAEVALPVAGILAEAPVAELAQDFEAFRAAAADLGVQGNAVTLLTSLPLPVVPRFRPTDMGLVDVEKQEFVSAYVFEP